MIGRKLDVNRVPFTIVGVSARGFLAAHPGTEPDFWMPLTMQSDVHYQRNFTVVRDRYSSKPWVPQEKRIQWLHLIVRIQHSSVVPHLIAEMNQQDRQSLELLLQNQNDV